MENITQIQKEHVKLGKSVSGKYSYELKLLGSPEENEQRIKDLKAKYDAITAESE